MKISIKDEIVHSIEFSFDGVAWDCSIMTDNGLTIGTGSYPTAAFDDAVREVVRVLNKKEWAQR